MSNGRSIIVAGWTPSNGVSFTGLTISADTIIIGDSFWLSGVLSSNGTPVIGRPVDIMMRNPSDGNEFSKKTVWTGSSGYFDSGLIQIADALGDWQIWARFGDDWAIVSDRLTLSVVESLTYQVSCFPSITTAQIDIEGIKITGKVISLDGQSVLVNQLVEVWGKDPSGFLDPGSWDLLESGTTDENGEFSIWINLHELGTWEIETRTTVGGTVIKSADSMEKQYVECVPVVEPPPVEYQVSCHPSITTAMLDIEGIEITGSVSTSDGSTVLTNQPVEVWGKDPSGFLDPGSWDLLESGTTDENGEFSIWINLHELGTWEIETRTTVGGTVIKSTDSMGTQFVEVTEPQFDFVDVGISETTIPLCNCVELIGRLACNGFGLSGADIGIGLEDPDGHQFTKWVVETDAQGYFTSTNANGDWVCLSDKEGTWKMWANYGGETGIDTEHFSILVTPVEYSFDSVTLSNERIASGGTINLTGRVLRNGFPLPDVDVGIGMTTPAGINFTKTIVKTDSDGVFDSGGIQVNEGGNWCIWANYGGEDGIDTEHLMFSVLEPTLTFIVEPLYGDINDPVKLSGQLTVEGVGIANQMIDIYMTPPIDFLNPWEWIMQPAPFRYDGTYTDTGGNWAYDHPGFDKGGIWDLRVGWKGYTGQDDFVSPAVNLVIMGGSSTIVWAAAGIIGVVIIGGLIYFAVKTKGGPMMIIPMAQAYRESYASRIEPEFEESRGTQKDILAGLGSYRRK